MSQEKRERWHCMSAACREGKLIAHSAATTENRPRCLCGSEMKKAYTPPVFRYLEFLQLDQLSFAEQTPRKD